MKILGGYEMKKSQILELLSDMASLAHKTGYETKRMKELVNSHENSLKSDRICIAVVGEWNNGKSTVINSLLGCELLVSENKECTAAITEIVYSERKYIKVFGSSPEGRENPLVYKNDISSEDISSVLHNYTTTGKHVETEVESVEIGWPYPLLDKNITLIDTPGVNSHSDVRSTLTYSILPRCHAILVVIDINKPGTTFDIEFIRKIKNKASDNIFFIINKIDTVLGTPAYEVGMETARKTLQAAIPNPHIIGISSQAALYSELIKRSAIDPAEVKTPSLKEVVHGTNSVTRKDPGYTEALYEMSNIASLYEILSKYFTREYGLGYLFNRPLSYMEGAVIEIINFLELQRQCVQSTSKIEQFDNDISRFEKSILRYDSVGDKTINFSAKRLDEIIQKYKSSMDRSAAAHAIYKSIEHKIEPNKIKELIANKNEKLVILVQSAIMEYTANVASKADTELLELKEMVDKRLADVARDIKVHINTKIDTPGKQFNGVPGDNLGEASMKTDPTSSFAASGVFGGTAAAAVLSVSGTSLVTGTTILSFSTGIGASLPFLASNPIGWAVGAALITGGIGYLLFRKKLTPDSIMQNLRDQTIVEMGLDHIRKETEKFFEKFKSTTIREIEDIINDLVFKARHLLDERRKLRGLEATEVQRKIEEIEDSISFARSLHERISTACQAE